MTSSAFTATEYQLYGRQIILPELGTEGQRRLTDSHVLVIGAGGLGAPALLYLAGAGIGHITVIDNDQVELSNLHRQVIHTYASVGNSKAESAAAALRSLNPTITVTAVRDRLSESNIDSRLEGVDTVIDGSDNFATRYLASAACARAKIPHIWGALLGFDAQMSVFHAGHGPVYEDLYPQAPVEGEVPTCATAGVIGAMAGVVGASMAMEAIKIIAGIGQPLIGQVGYYSALEGRWEYIPLRARKPEAVSTQKSSVASAENTGKHYTAKRDIADEFFNLPHKRHKTECTFEEYQRLARFEEVVLIDIRGRAEFIALAIPGAVNVPLEEIKDMADRAVLKNFVSAKFRLGHQSIVLYCSAGPRAEYAASLLRDAGCRTVYSLAGGLAGWLQQAGRDLLPTKLKC